LHTSRNVVTTMERCIVLLLTLFVGSVVQSASETGWRGIVPLRSTRTQVERELGPLDTNCQCYKMEHEIVHVTYANGRCTGDLPGWNVPQDTVLTLTIRPFREILWSEIEPNKKDFVRTMDDTFTAYYGNGNKGLRYSVSSAGLVKSVSYLPSNKDNSYRCAGFPLSDGGITDYSPYDQFPYDSLNDITSRLGEFTVRLQKLPTYSGYIVVYAGRKQETHEVASFAKRAREYLIKEFHANPKTIVALNGGYRGEPVVELFLIPSTWPSPVPTPTFGGILK
jgi:hypothetical protein